MPIFVAPSILAADFTRLGDEVKAVAAAGADMIHVDVMDGNFVPNITMGQPVVQALRKLTKLPLDVHLMIADADRYVSSFAEAGADIITVHAEACPHLHRTLQAIRQQGKKAGLALNPATSVESVKWVLSEIDLLLIMSVNPGFGGQKFIDFTYQKIREAKKHLDATGKAVPIEVDGGVVPENSQQIAAAGATILVSGTGVFGSPDYKKAIEAMKVEK